MDDSLFLRSVMIADDVRQELNRKEIAIGIYTNGVLTESFPTLLPTFAFRFELNFRGERRDTIGFKLTGPVGAVVIESSMQISFNEWDTNGIVLFQVSPMLFQIPGRYTIDIRFDDGEWFLARDFMVSTFEDERLRLAALNPDRG